MNFAREISVATTAAREAGAIALQLQDGIITKEKSDGSPVSEADTQADDIISRALIAAFPEDGLLSEERQDDGRRLENERVWIIDPIDGTRSYCDGGDEWGIHIGLCIGNEIALGIVFMPRRDRCLVGVVEHFADQEAAGCWLYEANGTREKISLPNDSDNVLLVSKRLRERPVMNTAQELLPEHNITFMSSVGIKVDEMLCGRANIYIHPMPIYEWDYAAPHAIYAAAGGMIHDLNGNRLTYNNADPKLRSGMCFSSLVQHDQLIAALYMDR